mgnify:CR=1 FL=1
MSKKKIAVLFGGQSSEHVVSCVSAANVIDQIDKEKYDITVMALYNNGIYKDKIKSYGDVEYYFKRNR